MPVGGSGTTIADSPNTSASSSTVNTSAGPLSDDPPVVHSDHMRRVPSGRTQVVQHIIANVLPGMADAAKKAS